MYRCSSLSISFRWIPNFYTGRKQECEVKKSMLGVLQAVTPFPVKRFLGEVPKVLGVGRRREDVEELACGSSGTG